MNIARLLLNGELDLTKELTKVFYTCTMCKYCSAQCDVDVSAVVQAVRQELVEKGAISLEIKAVLDSIYKYGNPWKLPRNKRGDWIQDAQIRHYRSSDDFLLHVGCVGSYDMRGIQLSKALGRVLSQGDLSFGVLGNDETCDGNEVDLLGENGLFQLLAEENIKKFKQLGVRRIVTLSPHAFNAIKYRYPQYGGNFEVMHYTQLIWSILSKGRLSVSRKMDARMTYHDPCHLGRYGEEYEAPRKILQAISGVKLIEMERNRETSFCCGGGGGNYYTNLLGSEQNSPARCRVREACATGADILAVACPVCMIMLEDAVKAEGLEDRISVKDIVQILSSCLQE